MKIIFTSQVSAQEIMDLDKKMLDELKNEKSSPILHFYQWQAFSITCGYFIDPKKFLNLKKIEQENIQIAKRPTGGGIIFHLWDMAFSFLMPKGHKNFYLNTLDNYHFVNSIVLQALQEFLALSFKDKELQLIKDDFFTSNQAKQNFCMARPTKYDILIGNKKIVGAAQRRTQNGYLHQGSIALFKPEEETLKKIIINPEVSSSIMDHSFWAFQNNIKVNLTLSSQEMLQKFLIKHFKRNL